MKHKIYYKEDVTFIEPEIDEIDAYIVPEFKQIIEEQLKAGHKKLIINLNHVSYIDSSALGLLVSQAKSIKKKNGRFKLLHLNTDIMKIFQMTKLINFFEIFDNEKQALISFNNNKMG